MEFVVEPRVLTVKVVGGETYTVSYPRLRHLEDYQAKLKDVPEEKQSDALYSFLEELGLPRDVSRDFEAHHLKMLVEELSGQKKS